MPPSKTDGSGDDRKTVVATRFNLANQAITVFRRPASEQERESYSLQLERRYRKRGGDFASSRLDLFPGDVATASALLLRAQAWLLDQATEEPEE
jgi:hypothetical protein